MTAGGGVTYPRVVELLKAEVAIKGQRTVSREIGIALLSVQRYIKGIGEPSLGTLQKLADYFEVSVAWLRGDISTISMSDTQVMNRLDLGKLLFENMHIFDNDDLSKLPVELLPEISNTKNKIRASAIKNITEMLQMLTSGELSNVHVLVRKMIETKQQNNLK